MGDQRKIGIWFGGCSAEYDVSLQSAYAVITHLDRNKYRPVLVGINREGGWYLFEGNPDKIVQDTWLGDPSCTPVTLSMNRKRPGLMMLKPDGNREIALDAAFPVLHGKNGEDGTLQGALELAGIPVVGCGTLASAVCMDKDMAHHLAAKAGVKVPQAYAFTREHTAKDRDFWNNLRAWAEDLGYPLFVKPVRAGSSFGITKAYREEELEEAVALAFSYDNQCIMEEAIPGFEVGCAVLGTKELETGEVDEIELSRGFFDFTEKYSLKTSAIHVPARIPKEKALEIKKTAKNIYRALGCSNFARVDMFLTPGGDIYFNEINTIPGFTAHSRFPNMMKAAGMQFEILLDRILENVLRPEEEETKERFQYEQQKRVSGA